MENDVYNLLRKDIRSKIGKEVLHGKDWISLSERISNDTQRHISVSTLKRFFGIITSPFNPSRYTLETLSIFLGFEDWHDYQNYHDDTEFIKPDGETWEILKNRITKITQASLVSLKERTGYTKKKIIKREYAIKKFNHFMQAQEAATLFTAPDGYGKSTTLIQIAECFLDTENQNHSNDILLLIDSSIFFNLYSQGSNYELFDQLLDYKAASSIGFYFLRNPEKRKGRFLIIIDDIDELFAEREKYHNLIENLMRMIIGNESHWHKMIFTCKPENLDILFQLFLRNPIYRSYWYKLGSDETNPYKNKNIPQFAKEEIDEVLLEKGYAADVMTDNPLLYKLAAIPPFLFRINKSSGSKKATVTGLLQDFLHSVLFTGAFKEEKLSIINSFVDLCNWGKENTKVEKVLLKSTGTFCNTAYRNLISQGILHEYEISEGMLGGNIYTEFNSLMVFAYILLDKWRKNEQNNVQLMQKLNTWYNGNMKLRSILVSLLDEIDQKEITETQLELKFEQKLSLAENVKRSIKT